MKRFDYLLKTLKNKVYFLFSPVISFLRKLFILAGETKLNDHYLNIIKSIQSRDDKIVRFAAYVMYDSDYGFDNVFRLMMMDTSLWSPMVVVIPDVSRGEDHKRKIYCQTKDYFIEKYGNEYVMDGWNMEDEYFDHLDKFDVIYFNNPYDDMAHQYHKIIYASQKNVLPIYITYGYEISKYYTMLRQKSREINLLWRCYTDTIYSYQDYCKYETRKGRNVKLIGYSKMDELDSVLKKYQNKNRKTVLITPHHTVDDSKLPLSNFLNFYFLIPQLPELYPNIDFVFRPHPLLFVSLVNKGIWNQKQVDEYLENLYEKGIIYSQGGDYFDLFSKADAIINDSGSFTVEWLFTGKPGCFVRNPQLKDAQLTTLMKKSISEYHVAFSENDIISFLDSLNSDYDDSEYEMKEWVKQDIAINYPNVADYILNDLTHSICWRNNG